MNSAIALYCRNISTEKIIPKKNIPKPILKFPVKNERKILKTFLLGWLHQLFREQFQNEVQINQNNSSMECYAMDNKIIQLLIQGIVKTGEYTLEGIAYHTRIPFDIIFDAACGSNNQFSITSWARIVDLYIQVNPDIEQTLIDKLFEMKEKKYAPLSLFLNES